MTTKHSGDRRPLLVFAGLTALVLFLTIAAPILTSRDPALPVGPQSHPPSAAFPLGTDQLGRDLLTRILHGMQSSWWGAFAVILVSVVIGGAVGLIAGTLGSVADSVLMRTTDLFLSLPSAILAVAIVSAIGPSYLHVLVAISTVWWTMYARVMRGEIRRLRALPHVEAAVAAGVGRFRLAARHLLPGAIPPLIVAASLDVGALILTLAGLSFLGLGAPDPATELGAMSQRGLPYLLTSWWIPVMPALALGVLVLIANFGGDALRSLFRDR